MKHKIEMMQYKISPLGVLGLYVIGEDKDGNEFNLDINVQPDQTNLVNYESTVNGVKINKKYKVPRMYFAYATLEDFLDGTGAHVIYNSESKVPNILNYFDHYDFIVEMKDKKNVKISMSNDKGVVYFPNCKRLEVFDKEKGKLDMVYYIHEDGMLVRNYMNNTYAYVRFEEDGKYTTYSMETVGTISDSVVANSINLCQRNIFYLLKQSVADSEMYKYDQNEVYPILIDLFNPDNSFSGTVYNITREKGTENLTEIVTIDFKYYNGEHIEDDEEDDGMDELAF